MATVDSILEITDGTTTVSLIDNTSGFGLVDWTPQIADLKGGGTFVSSSLSDGRKLVLEKFGNVIETLNLRVRGGDQDIVGDHLRELRQLLEKARTYWITDWAYEPVWIKAQGPHETNPRYATIHNWSTPQDDNPFVMPFFDCGSVLADEFTLLIEREPFWSNQPPGSDTAIAISVADTYDGRTVGNVDSAGTRTPTIGTWPSNIADRVFITNKTNIAQITDVYEDDGGVWSSNLMDASLPHRLLPATPAVDDAVYFGIDTSVSDSGPFHSLVFDIDSPPASDVTITWEAWTGSWTAFDATPPSGNFMDNTDGFSESYVQSVWFTPPQTWTTRNLSSDGGPSITGYWVRARVSAIGASPTGTTQENRDIYTVNKAYFDIQDDQIGGDVSSLARLRLQGVSEDDTGTFTNLGVDRVTFGTRSLDRGTDFTAYIPFSDVQEPFSSGYQQNLYGGASYVSDVQQAATGKCVQVSPGAPVSTFTEIIEIIMTSDTSAQYQGWFRAYLRVSPVSGITTAQNWFFKLAVNSDVNRWETPMNTMQVNELTAPHLVDLGLIKIPPAGLLDVTSLSYVKLEVFYATDDPGGGSINLYELILMPSDEYIGTFGAWGELDETGALITTGTAASVDSTRYPKREIYTPVDNLSTTYSRSMWMSISAEPVTMNTGKQLRVWFISENSAPTTPGTKFARFNYGIYPLLYAKRRYFGSIGGSA